MQGNLQRIDVQQGLLFRNNVTDLYARLNKNILELLEKNYGEIVGRIHLQIASLTASKETDSDCDFRINSGLFEITLRAPSIGEKCKWHNALSDVIRKESERHAMRLPSEFSDYSDVLNMSRRIDRLEKRGLLNLERNSAKSTPASRKSTFARMSGS